MSIFSYAVPIRSLIDEASIPTDFITSADSPLAPLLDRLFYTNYALVNRPDGAGLLIELVVAGEAAIGLPGLDGLAIVFGSTDAGATLIDAGFFFGTKGFSARVDNITVALRFPPSILKPVPESPGATAPPHAQIEVHGAINLDENFDLRFDGFDSLSLKPVMIGNSGIIISAEDVKIDFSRTETLPEIADAGFDENFMGVYIGRAQVKLPEGLPSLAPEDLVLENAVIGTGGVSGRLEAHYSPTYNPTTKTFSGHGAGTLFGIPFGIKDVAIEFKQNALLESGISGKLLLPFFEEPVDVEIAINLNGNFSVQISSANGLYTLTKAGLLELQLESIGFEVADGLFTAKLGGELKPLFGGLTWPTFRLKELAIDSQGHVHLDGGWLDLPSQYALDFHGFKIEITKLGFGKTDDGGKWVGFSGGLKLVEGLSAGASVEGLRVTWYDDRPDKRITLDGVGVEFEVPEVVRFKGAVSYRELTVGTELVHRFDGSIKLELLALDLQIDATLVVGSASGPNGTYTFFAIYLAVELPAGIPLASTGLGLYGLAGLFALSMEPDKRPDEPWYGVGATDGWYHRSPVGVTDLRNKWVNRRGSLAFGAGITIGTLSDNGYTFSGKVLLVIVFPGPILLIEGEANLLKERSKLDEEPLFRALAVLDGRAGTLLIGLDAQYNYGSSGELIKIRGGVEAFYNFSDADAWHLYLGIKDPRENRIRADLFQLFEANAYLMLDAHQLAMGAWVGYAKRWSFGPLSVELEAWLEGNAVISWKPAHLHGDLWLHGRVALRVFGFGLSLSVDARFDADVFVPFHVRAEISVSIDLPWPLKDYEADITLEWGPKPTNPPLPLPLKEIAVEHFKVTASWPLPRGGSQPLLLPNYDSNNDGFLEAPNHTVAEQAAAAAPAGMPVVPLDARPHLTFGRSVHDRALVGVNAQPVTPEYERIGDPAQNQGPVKVKYSLTEVALYKASGAGWTLVARKATTPNPAGVRPMYGSWAPVPALPDGGGVNAGQVKLWLWSKTPFDYTRHSGRAWDEWFTDKFSDYPCLPPLPDREICCDFEQLNPAQQLRSPWACPEEPGLLISWPTPLFQIVTVTILSQPVLGRTHALCFPPTAREDQPPARVTIKPPQPAKSVRIVVTQDQAPSERRCVDFRLFPAGSGPNPRVEQGTKFLVKDLPGAPSQPVTETRLLITTAGPLGGLNCSRGVEITLPCAASSIELILTQPLIPYLTVLGSVEVFNAANTSLGRAQMQKPPGTPETLTLIGTGITRIVVQSVNEAFLHQLCFVCVSDASAGVQATGFDGRNHSYGPFMPHGNVIEVEGDQMTSVVVTSPRRFCLVQVCMTVGADPAVTQAREEMMQHQRDELARWSQEGEVLEPHTTYRLKVVTTVETADAPIGNFEQTEFAYFRTGGPPGLTNLSVPIGSPNATEFDSGLEDLTRYVRQTIPATVPDAGQKPPLPRPVYRGYDVGAEFNENYVDLMYRLDRRDLGIYLYDNNNQPVRDARGRLIVLSNRWGKTEELSLSESDKTWINTLNESDCAALDTTVIPHDTALTSAAEGQVLDADTIYEARLVPLLLHESFSTYSLGAAANGPAGSLDRWSVLDSGSNAGPSHWEIREEGIPLGRFIIQTSNIWGGTTSGTDPVKPGTLLLLANDPALAANDPGQPGNWTGYRLSVYLRSATDHALGIVFRYLDANHFYRFSMDRQRKYRRLVRVVGAATTILAEDDFVYQQDQDYLISVEATGASLRIYQDGALVFDVADASMDHGRIGLYCWSNSGARFSDLRVDDFRATAPVVYRFKFTTSEFVNFFHHLHSFQDEVWRVTLPDAADIAPEVAQAVALPVPVADAETRAYESLASKVIGQAAKQNPPEVQITRVEKDSEALAFLLQSPEPIDWQRTSLQLSRASRWVVPPGIPRALKLTGVTFGGVQPNEESVTMLLRERMNLSGVRLEHRRFLSPIAPPGGDPLLLSDDFEGVEGGLLFEETFGTNALDRYTIVDEGTSLVPSRWAVSGGRIAQTSGIFGGSGSPGVPDKPGTMALTGSALWGNVRIRARLRSTNNNSIGMIFRYRDANNYYRFSMDRQRNFRRLIKKVEGVVTTLWEDHVAFSVNRSYQLEIEASEDQLLAYLDDALLFNVVDGSVAAGRVGFYCWANTGAFFEALSVEEISHPAVLWQPAFSDLDEVEIVDEAGASDGPSQWAVAGGALTQSSNINVPDSTAHKPGTYALGGKLDWRDVQICVRLRSNDDGALGVMFRFQDEDNYYRFSMDRQLGYRRLISKVGGVATTLWEQSVGYTVGQAYELTLRAVGHELRGYLDGVLLFTVYDDNLKNGRVAFYCWADTGARFERVVMIDRTRRAGRWTLHDEGTINSPSVWRMAGGALIQKSAISGGTPPASPGTTAVTGDPAWRDYRFSVQLRSDTDQAIGLVFRYIDDDNYYRVSINSHDHYRRLIKKFNGVVTTLWEDAGGYAAGDSLLLTVEAVGSRLSGFIGTTQLFALNDNALVSGQVGLYCQANDGARFEQVLVEQPSLEACALFRDRFAEHDISAWTVIDDGTTSRPSRWAAFQGTLRQTSAIFTPPNDRNTLSKRGTHAVAGDAVWTDVAITVRLQSWVDDAIGLLFRYTDADNYYRFSMDRQRGYRRLVKNVGGTFTLLWEDSVRYEIRRIYELTVVAIGSTLRGYIDGVPVFTVEDNELSSGRIGLYCWGNVDARFSQVRVYSSDRVFDEWLLDEPFVAPTGDRWTFIDDGDQQVPSQWTITNGELRQTSSIYGGSMARNVPDKPGTYALSGDAAWTDYRVGVQLRSDSDAGVGVIFRYQDGNNYYRFSMDRLRSYRRLVKKVNGVFTVLWEDAVRYESKQFYMLTLDCVGERLTGYLNGSLLFSLDDPSLASGRIGLYCWNNPGARFGEVRVSSPAWSTYYTFKQEEMLPAGTRVRIFAGNLNAAPPAEPGLMRRFAASLDQLGQLQFSSQEADLRLVAPDKTVGHRRRFLGSSQYAPVAMRVLRKADGTGFFIVVPATSPAGTRLNTGQYRLKLNYLRNNKASDPTSQIFSETGNRGPEEANIDIPWDTH
jgi:hypothetical protein